MQGEWHHATDENNLSSLQHAVVNPYPFVQGQPCQTSCLHTVSLHCTCRGDPIKPDYDNVASVVFSSPQVAKVGIDEEAAKEKIGDVDIFTTTFT